MPEAEAQPVPVEPEIVVPGWLQAQMQRDLLNLVPGRSDPPARAFRAPYHATARGVKGAGDGPSRARSQELAELVEVRDSPAGAGASPAGGRKDANFLKLL